MLAGGALGSHPLATTFGASDPVFPSPSGGGNFMLLGVRAVLLVLLPSMLWG